MGYQKQVFEDVEGDNWFDRNKEMKDVSIAYKTIEKYLDKKSKVLEIGCSYGGNLNYFYENIGCDCYGVDPSSKAIKYGKQEYPYLHLSIGAADDVRFPDEYFDVVIFGFCLYLVDRNLLSRAVAEGDRVTKNNGFLAIIDFDTKLPIKKDYKHYKGVSSYKFDYSSIFLSYPHYSSAEKISFSHKMNQFDTNIDERVSTTILYKDHAVYYEK